MDTIFALSSGRPPAAVSVIRVSGPAARDALRALGAELPEARNFALRSLFDLATGERLDDAILLRFDAPASATGEDVVEIQCHGGRAVVDALLKALGSIDGLRLAAPGEFTRRAFENGRIDLTEAEGLADLIEAETETQRKAALAAAEGGLRKQIETWQQRLLGLSAEAERAIDYDEDDGLVDPGLLRGCEALASELGEWLARPRMEPLKDGVRVVVAGPPNTGKSSLINAIAGSERAIVTDVPGTTRDRIEVPLSLNGAPILLIDTAGLRETADVVEAIGVERASASIEAADIVVWMGEADEAPARPRLIRLHAQADRPERGDAAPGALPVSALTGAGVGVLLERIANFAADFLPGEGALALNRRQAAALQEARDALAGAARSLDLVIAAEQLRAARAAFDRLTGRAGVEDLLDSLFARFCLGK